MLLVARIDCDAKGVCRERGVAGETSLAMGQLAVIWRPSPAWMEPELRSWRMACGLGRPVQLVCQNARQPKWRFFEAR